MFKLATVETVRRARPQTGNITPSAIPFKGLNARAPFSVMGSEYAIALNNVIVEPFGLRTRKGYNEWAKNLPGTGPVGTLMVYYPQGGVITPSPGPGAGSNLLSFSYAQLFVPAITGHIESPIQLFADREGSVYDVSGGGIGPHVAMSGISGASTYWTWINFQNVAGSFLLATNDDGGYAYYNGSAWATPTAGAGVGQIDGVDPADLVFVMEWKRRVWFIEKNSTSAWYLPVEQITGTVHEFDFGPEFAHGGYLVALVNWTVDSGSGIDDRLVVVGSQGDIAIYQGTDPDNPDAFNKIGTWYVGPLPNGRRCVTSSGGDVFILTQFGVMPVSRIQSSAQLPVDQQAHISYLVDPLLARLMQLYAAYKYWRIFPLAREELIVIQLPQAVQNNGGFFAYKTTTQAWSSLTGVPYSDIASIDNQIFAGTYDGRVVQAFNGTLDDVKIDQAQLGSPIVCHIIPAYQNLGGGGRNNAVTMIRPTFLAVVTPQLGFRILLDYSAPGIPNLPTLPVLVNSLWDDALWDVGIWSGLATSIREWLGARGVGFAVTAQLDYACGGDTLLMSLDYWTTKGNVL